MLSSLTFFFGLLAAYFWLQQRHSRTLLNNVIESIKSGRNSILEKSPFLSSDLPINEMQLVLDENFEKISKLQDERKNRIHAFNEILGGMVNGALILDANHRITFSNTSCNKIFGRGSEFLLFFSTQENFRSQFEIDGIIFIGNVFFLDSFKISNLCMYRVIVLKILIQFFHVENTR